MAELLAHIDRNIHNIADDNKFIIRCFHIYIYIYIYLIKKSKRKDRPLIYPYVLIIEICAHKLQH